MSNKHPKTYLLDGPLMLAPERKAALILQMAAELMEEPAYMEREDAIRALHRSGYNAVDVMMLADDARAVAVQEIVAKEMSEEP